MARFPGGRWAPLPENSTQGGIRPTQIILHTAVDAPGPTRLERYFAREDVHVESHFWITLSGEVVQMMDTEIRADANRTANRRPDGTGAISIETEDEGDPVGVPWTPAQIISIVDVIRWASKIHGIPLRRAGYPSAPGLGYHSMFGAPSAWTPSRGKTCPGPTRIHQFNTVLLPLLQEEDDMLSETESRAFVKALYSTLLLREPDAAGLAHWTGVGTQKGALALFRGFLVGAQAEIQANRSKTERKVAELEAELDELKAQSPVAPADLGMIVDQVAAILADRLED